MNLLTKQKETHRLRKQTHGYQREGIVRGFGKVMYTLLYLKRITTKTYCIVHLLNVMCQPGWEGDWGRMNTCVCMAESLHCSPEIITTLLIGYTPIQNDFGITKNKN